MASAIEFVPQLSPVLRGIAHRVTQTYRRATTEAVEQVRGPLVRAAREFVAGKIVAARSFEGAQFGRRGENWLAPGTGPNAELISDFATLRNRARERVRNDPLAARIVDASVGYVVGAGIVPHSNTGAAGLDRRVDALFSAWAQSVNFYAMQALAWRSMVESGEALALRRTRWHDGSAVPLGIELLEGDYLDHLITGAWAGPGVASGNFVVQGVEIDPQNQPAAYWLWQTHPGEMSLIAMPLPNAAFHVRVPASDLLHLYRVQRPGQLRGITVLSPVLWTLRQIGLYLDAELERKGTEALVTAIVTNPDAGSYGIGDLSVEQTGPNSTSQVIGSLEPGAVINVPASTGVQFSHPTAIDSAAALKGFLRRVATGVGIPYELISADLEGVNYSSIRYGTLPFRTAVEQHREHVMIPFLQRVWGWWVDAAIAAGELQPRAGGYPVTWAAPKWEEIDREKEAVADVMEIRAGLRSQLDVIRQRGDDWRQILADTASWLDDADKAGVSFDTDPRRPQIEKSAPVEAPDTTTLDTGAEKPQPSRSRAKQRRKVVP